MDYQNGKIYQLLNSETDDIYVGSTCSSLSKRLYHHRENAKRDYKNYAIYKKMKELGSDKFYIELIETYPCNNKNEVCAREGQYIRERATLNSKIEGRSTKQWREDNHEELMDKKRTYYNENKNEILERKKDEFICECGCTYKRTSKARHMKSTKHKNLMQLNPQDG